MRKTIVVSLMFILAACGGSSSTTSSATSTKVGDQSGAQAAASPAATSPLNAPPGSADLGGALPGPGTVEDTVAQTVAPVLNIPYNQLRVLNKQAQQWPDSSLGCPAAGSTYTQVVTPGYLLTYTDGTKNYEVHSDQTGNQAVVCENGQPRNKGS